MVKGRTQNLYSIFIIIWKWLEKGNTLLFNNKFFYFQISEFLPYRTPRQVYSHSRKFFKTLQRNFTLEESLKIKNYYLTNDAENIVKQIINNKISFQDFDYYTIQKLIMSIFGIKGTKKSITKNNNISKEETNKTFNSLTSKIQTKLYLFRNLNLFEQNERKELNVIIFKNTPKDVLNGMFNIEEIQILYIYMYMIFFIYLFILVKQENEL